MSDIFEHDKYFPALNLPVLSEYARGWAEDFSEVPIEKIILKRAKMHTKISRLVDRIIEREGRESRSIRRPKYEIIFVLPEHHLIYSKSIMGASGRDALWMSLADVRGGVKPEVMNIERLRDTGKNPLAEKFKLLLDGNGKEIKGYTKPKPFAKFTPSPMQIFLDIIEYERSPYDNSPRFKYLMPDGQFEDVYCQAVPLDSWRDDWNVNICKCLGTDFSLVDTEYVFI